MALGLFDPERRHAGLLLHRIHCVINPAREWPQAEQGGGEGVVGPQPGAAETQAEQGDAQSEGQAEAVEHQRQAGGSTGPDEGRPHPDAGTHAPGTAQPTPQAFEDPGEIARRGLGRPQTERFHIENTVPLRCQGDGHMLLVGPEGVVPVSRCQEHNISHTCPQRRCRSTSSRKLADLCCSWS